MGRKKTGLALIRLPKKVPSWYEKFQINFLNEISWGGDIRNFENGIMNISSNWKTFKEQCDRYDENIKKIQNKNKENKKKKVKEDEDDETLEDELLGELKNKKQKNIDHTEDDMDCESDQDDVEDDKKRKSHYDSMDDDCGEFNNNDNDDNENNNIDEELDDQSIKKQKKNFLKNNSKKKRKPIIFNQECEIYKRCNDLYIQYLSSNDDKIIKNDEFKIMWEAYRRLALLVVESGIEGIENVIPIDTLRNVTNDDVYDDNPPTPKIE